jgi:serine/threonine protein kinase
VRTRDPEFDPEFLAIMEKEYQILKQIEHPHIIRAYDFFSSVDNSVLVMELFDGPSLESMVRSSEGRHLQVDTSRLLFCQLLQAIDYLHRHRIVHRDVKAANILVSQDQKDLRLVDFNTARCLREGLSLTMTGTLDYAAPEILQGESPSECGDIWSAGLCLHFMLAGRLPRRREQFASLPDFAEAVATRKVTLHGRRWSGIPESCKVMLQQCLEVNMSLRPTAATLLGRHYQGSPRPGTDGKLHRVRTEAVTLRPSTTRAGDAGSGYSSPSNKARGHPSLFRRSRSRARSLPSPIVRRGGCGVMGDTPVQSLPLMVADQCLPPMVAAQ